MASLTRRGALSVTSDLDRIASLFQAHHESLGVPKEYAVKFAYYCDAMSDTVEKHALAIEKAAAEESEKKEEEPAKDEGEKKEAGCEKLPEGGMRDNCEAKKEEGGKSDDKDEKSDDKKDEKDAPPWEKKEAKAKKSEEVEEKVEEKVDEKKATKAPKGKKAADDETGLSVDHGTSGFDANAIGDEVSGPDEILAPVEAWMNSYFDQNWFQQLREKQQGGDIGFFVSASKARLRRLAALSQLSGLEDVLKAVHAKLDASDIAEVKGLAADVKKQVDAVSKVRDLTISQQATGMVEPEVVMASETILKAVTEQLPYLKQVLTGVDGSSPVALLEFQKMLGGGSLKELVGLGASIVADAAKGLGKKDEGKEAAKSAEEAPPKSDEEKKEEEPAKEASAKAAEDEKVEDEEKEETGKEAGLPSTFGYDLFAN